VPHVWPLNLCRWTICFQFLLLLVMLLTCFTNAFERARTIYLAYLTMVTVLLTNMATKFISNSFSANGINLKDYKSDASNAAAAGSVLLCITNFALVRASPRASCTGALLGAHACMASVTNQSAADLGVGVAMQQHLTDPGSVSIMQSIGSTVMVLGTYIGPQHKLMHIPRPVHWHKCSS
jgi:hypothetical protein